MSRCYFVNRNKLFWDNTEHTTTSDIVQYIHMSTFHRMVCLDENGDLWCIKYEDDLKRLPGLGPLKSFSCHRDIIIGITFDDKVVSAHCDYNLITLLYTTIHANIGNAVKLSGRYALSSDGIAYELSIQNTYVRNFRVLPVEFNNKLVNIEVMNALLVLVNRDNNYKWLIDDPRRNYVDGAEREFTYLNYQLDVLRVFPKYILTKDGYVRYDNMDYQYDKICLVPSPERVVYISQACDVTGNLLLVLYDSGSTLVYYANSGRSTYSNFDTSIGHNIMPLESQVLRSR